MIKFSTPYATFPPLFQSRSTTVRLSLFLLCAAIFLLLLTSTLHSQIVSRDNIVTIHNEYVAASVKMDQKAGRFWISAGSKNGWHRYLYHGSKAVQNITSNVVFRIGDRYFCNTTDDFALGPRPAVGISEAEFRPYDSIRYTADTIEVLWVNLAGYDIIMRFVVEDPPTIYDDGADVLIEFEYKNRPNIPNIGTLWIFLMLDGDNGAAQDAGTGGGGDKSSIMTTQGYFPSYSSGRSFNLINKVDTIPLFYHVGNFEYGPGVDNDLMPIHRLKGFSAGGAPITTPTKMGVGNWQVFRRLAGEPIASDPVGDVATCLQWDSLAGKGIIRTAFGTNSKAGNSAYICRDIDFFADIRTVRIIEQKEKNGPYVPSRRIAVELWLTNTSNREVYHPTVRLKTPISSMPYGSERLKLDPSTPQDQQKVDGMLPRMTERYVWYLNLDPQAHPEDTLVRLEFEYKKRDGMEFAPFADACTPLITIRPFEPPPTDTLPPVIERRSSGKDFTYFWSLQTYDRHPSFDYDTGIDSIEILRNDGNRFRLNITPQPFRRCDVSETVNIRAEVRPADTATESRIVFRVWDCNGNSTIDSIIYRPRPDIFAPQVWKRDSTGSWDPIAYPCNARVRTVTIIDALNQFPEAGDYGLGRRNIEVVSLQNFQQPVITDQRDWNEIRDFDSIATISLTVIDPLWDAEAEIKVGDYSGNDTTLYFEYCTIHDFLPPIVSHTQQSNLEWEINASDERDWDRGLYEINVVSNNNFAFIWPDGTRRDSIPSVVKGAGTENVAIEVIDKCNDAELIVEVRDTYYDTDPNPETHHAFDTIRYKGIPDTLAPNIMIIPGFDGNTYYFDVRVDDIHYLSGLLFDCDRGLDQVLSTNTPNLRVRTPLNMLPNGKEATISFEVIDTLAIDRIDTLCITAIDKAGNRSSDCAFWPSVPDGKSPIFIGRLEPTTMAIVGTARDDRENDRGLGSVTLRSALNLNPSFGLLNLRGIPDEDVTITSNNPEGPIAGEIVVQDLYGELLNTPENSLHTVVIPFHLPIVRLSMNMPGLIDANTIFDVDFIADIEIDGDHTHTVMFELETSGPATPMLNGGIVQASVGNFTATQAGNRLLVQYDIAPGEKVAAGERIGTIRFDASMTSTQVKSFYLRFIPTTAQVNNGQDNVILVKKVPTDPISSQLTLPPPLLRFAGDSLTWINGDCNRVLGSPGNEKPTGLTILALEPQPLTTSRQTVTTVLRGLTEEGGKVEWISPSGQQVGHYTIEAGEEEVGRYIIPVPTDITPGMYFLRISSAEGVASQKVLIVQ